MTKALAAFSKIDLSKIVEQLDQLLQHNLAEIDQLLKQPPPFNWSNLMLPIEELDNQLSLLWAPISHLHCVADSDQLREVYGACLPKLTEYGMAISHNKALYQAVQSIKDGDVYQTLDQAQQKVIDNQLRDFKLAGVALSQEKQKQYGELVQSLSKLTTKFEENILDATKAWSKHISDEAEMSGLPETTQHAALEAAKQKGQSGWLLTLDVPNYLAVMTHADSSALRQEMYTAYMTRASDQGPFANQWDNTPVIQQILEKRLQLAKLLDFPHYAEESLATKMADSPKQVLDFLQHLLDASLGKAKQEFQQVVEFAKQNDGIETLNAWDVAYYSEQLRQQQYNIAQEELRPYFPEYRVLAGLFEIVQRLYGVQISEVKGADTWHKDAHCFAVHDASGQCLSYIYLDLYARSSKRGGAWMNDTQARRRDSDGKLQLPVAYVNCNFNGSVGGRPALFTHDEVVTLFHELGHALQHVLSQVDYADVSGINGIPWDAVEFPSQFFENWAWEREAVDLIAEHYETKQALPDELYQRMQRAKNFQAAIQMVRQLEFSLYDFRLHIEFDPNLTNQAQTLLDEIRSQTNLYPMPAFNRFQNGFSHIFAGGYAAGYYSYKWAEVMASDAFELFKQQGIFDSNISGKFRTVILERGGAEEPMDLFVQFRGREPKVEALLRQQGIIDSNATI